MHIPDTEKLATSVPDAAVDCLTEFLLSQKALYKAAAYHLPAVRIPRGRLYDQLGPWFQRLLKDTEHWRPLTYTQLHGEHALSEDVLDKLKEELPFLEPKEGARCSCLETDDDLRLFLAVQKLRDELSGEPRARGVDMVLRC